MTFKKLLYNTALLCCLVTHIVHAASQEVTTKGQLDNAIKSSKTVIVKFYSPECPHCRNFAPIFEEASNKNAGLPFISVNILKYPTLSAPYKIGGLPTIIYFVNGTEVDRTMGSNAVEFKQKLATFSKK